MKLRLPSKLQAALIAALASVSFTTLSTGTIAVATGAALLAGQQAQADEPVKTPLELTVPSGQQLLSGNSGLNWTTSGTTGALSSWEVAFTLTTSTNKEFFNLNASNSAAQGYHLTLEDGNTITLKDNSGNLVTSVGGFTSGAAITLSFRKDVNDSGTALGTGTFYLTVAGTGAEAAVSNIATSGDNDTTFHTGSSNSGPTRFWTTSGNLKFTNIQLYQLNDNIVTISDFTWNGTVAEHDWSQNVWNGGVAFGDNSNAKFTDAGYNEVDITTSVTANAVSVEGQNYTFGISGGGSLTTGSLTVNSGLSTSGTGTLAVTGGVTLGDGAGLTIGEGTTLKVSNAAAAKALMMSNAVTNNGIFEIAGDVTLDNGVSTAMGGTLKVDSGVTLKLSQSKDLPTSIESFTSVELAGGNLWANTTMRTINVLSVTENSQISFEDFPNAYASNPTKFTGTTRIDSGKTLTIYTNYKSSIQIAGLAGAGTLKMTTANRDDNGENVTIDSLEGFSGDISLAPGNANNPVRVTASLGNADVSMGTLSLNGNSAAATDTKHTFYKLTGEHNLTMTGIDGTNGEVSLTVPTLTLNTDSNHSYTGSLSISGQLVKTGAGSQTLGGYEMHKAIDVQAGTLVLTGMYDITHIEMDPGVTYSYKNEHGEDSPDSVGGFRATSGSKTVYTKDASATVTDGAATYRLDGKDVQLTDGKYNYMPEADLTELWVNGGSLSYDAYYAASGETPALTTAKVAGGATLAIGEHAVGTLEYQTNGSTIGLSGTGRVNAISGTGTLNLESGAVVTLGYNPEIASGQTFTTTGMGELVAEYIASTGGTVTIGSRLHLTKANDRTKGLSITNANGSIAINDDAAIDGSMYVSAGSVTIGGGRVEVGRIEFGDVDSAAASELTVNAGATLHVKGGDVSANYHSTGLLLGEWEGVSTLTVFGNLYADQATAYVGDKQAVFNIENGGVMAVKGIGINDAGSGKSGKNQIINLNLKDGGKLVLGASGISSNKTLSAEFGHAEVGMTADTTLAKDITLTSSEGTTFNTTKYKWEGEGAQLTLATDTVGGTMTVSGALGGTGKLIANGAGTLVLSGANTYSGGTAVNGGTLKAASDGALGTGDVTVNGATLELTTTTAVAGDLTVNNGGTLVFAGANMLTADTLALGSGTVTFDLSKINVSHAGTITLATAATSASLGSATVQVVWEGLAPIFSHNGVQVSDNSWIITLTSPGQDLYWNGGTANWDATAESWHTEAAPEEPVPFNSGDTAIFAADTTQAVANISGAIETGGVIVRDGADVVLQEALEAQEASINAPEIEISGALVSSVDMTATGIVGRGTAATWEIAEDSTVTTATLSAEEGAKLTISGKGSLYAETVTGDGTIVFTGDIQPEYSKIVVAEGKELTLDGSVTRTISKDNLAIDGKLIIGRDYSLTIDGAYNPGTAGTDLHIRNNGSLAVSLGNDQNVLRMDEQSAGNLEIKSGNLSYLSELGNQTVTMDNGTQLWFGNNAGTKDAPDFTNDIVLNGNVTLRVYGNSMHDSVTISGDVSGEGHTLTKNDGNQNLSFTGEVNLGAFTTDSNAGGTIAFSGDSVSIGSVTTNGSATVVFNGGSATIGAIATKQGSTIQFSNKEGAESSSYSFDTFELGSNGADAARWLVVDANVTVEGKKDTLTKGAVRATISNDWGIDGGGVKVDGILNLAGEISMDGPESNYIKGAGIINTTGLNLCNGSTTYIQDGITVNITTSAGIHRRNNNADLHFANATLAAVNDEEGAGADWTLQSGYSHVYLDDSTNGTTFKAASNRTITLASAMEGTGKLVKAGEGIVKLTGANTYSGGTTVNAGTLLAQNASALGSGVVNITGGNLVIGAVMNDYSANEFHNTGGTLTMNDGSKLTMFATGGTRTYDLGNVVVNGSAGIVTKVNNSCFNAQLNMTSLVSAADGAEIVLASGAQFTKATVFSLNTNQTAAYNGTITVMESQTNAGARPVALNVALGADAAEADVLKGAVIVLDNANNDGNLVGLGLGSDVTVKGIDSGNTATNGTHVIFAGAATTSNDSFSSSGEARTLTVDTAGTDHSTRAKVLDKVNLVKQGAGTQTFSGDMSSFNGSVSAEGGTLNVLNAESLAVQNVHIGEGAVFGVYSGDTATASTGTEGSITITENNVLSALENATLNANLVMEAGSTLDVSYAQDSYGLIMGSSVTLKEGVLLQDSLHQQQYPDINDFLFEYLSDNDYYYLYDDVEELYIQQGGTTQQVYELNFTDWRHFDLDASHIFTNLNENTYALVYNWNTDNTGCVALVMIPEPTTGTLSLLALCALAARRRRK